MIEKDINNTDRLQYNLRYCDFENEPITLTSPIEGYQHLPLLPLELACESIEHIIPDIQRRVWIAKSNYHNTASSLTEDEQSSIRLYTMQWEPHHQCLYVKLNETLRSEDRQKLKPWFPYLKLILTALFKLPSKENSILWRGIKMDLSQKYIKDQIYTWYGFSSCTDSLEVLKSELFLGQTGSRTLFSIECNNGKYIKDYSCYKSEDEILLLPATQFQVRSKVSPAPGLHIIHLKEIKPKYHLLESPFDSTSISLNSVQTNNNGITPILTTFKDISISLMLQEDATKNKTTVGMNSNCNQLEQKSLISDGKLNEYQTKESSHGNQLSMVGASHLTELSSTLELLTMNDILQSGSIIRNRWKILRKIRDFTFTQLYEAIDTVTKENVSLKVESTHQPKQCLKMDVTVLRRLQTNDHIYKFLGGGTTDLYNFAVTSLQGKSLDTLRNSQTGQRFSLSTSIRISLQMLKCIETIHSIGFLHRDIQPCNFTMGCLTSTCRQVFLSNFEQARKFTDLEGNVRSARSHAEYHGNIIYASIKAANNYDMGRCDDLWSLFYILMEFIMGNLPWTLVNDNKQIKIIKEQFDHKEFLKFLPSNFDKFLKHIEELNYKDKPNYDLLENVFCQSIISHGYKDSDLFDWEEASDSKITS